MRIAQIAPLVERIPPWLHGGPERVVHWLTDELVRLGHTVTLFAGDDARTRAELSPAFPRRGGAAFDPLLYHVRQVHEVMRRAAEFDVLHFHSDYIHLPLASRQSTPYLTTLHGRLDLPDLPVIYEVFPEASFVSLSDAQRAPLPQLRWAGTIYPGLPEHLFTPSFIPGGYLVFLGRIAPEMGVVDAIHIARRSGVPLKIAATVDPADRAYFDVMVAPLVDGAQVELVGAIGDHEKGALLAGALALVAPIQSPEPSGLAMMEAMACGTPVIAHAHGCVPEVIDEGESGLVVHSVASGVRAVHRAASMNRALCRRAFEERFTVRAMAQRYVAAYRELVGDDIVPERPWKAHAGGPRPRSAAPLPLPTDVAID